MCVYVCACEEGGWIGGGQGMFLSLQCGRDDTGITGQVPLTKAGWVGTEEEVCGLGEADE